MMNFILVIATIALLVLLFLIFRAVVLWYFKIDHVIDRLDSILAELKQANGGEINSKK